MSATGNENEQQNAELKESSRFRRLLATYSIEGACMPFGEQDGHAAAIGISKSGVIKLGQSHQPSAFHPADSSIRFRRAIRSPKA